MKKRIEDIHNSKIENKIELTIVKKTKIDLSVIPPYFFILNTMVLFSFLIYLN